MRYTQLKQTKVVTGSTADDFQQRLNEALAEVASESRKYELSFNNTMGFCAYIVYDLQRQYAETLSDEYELRGETYKCYECPMFNPSEDRRVKYTTCKNGERHTYYSKPACEWFYEELENGRITPI